MLARDGHLMHVGDTPTLSVLEALVLKMKKELYGELEPEPWFLITTFRSIQP